MDDRKVFTVRISKSMVKNLKFLSVELERSMGQLVEEGLADLIKKYEKPTTKKGEKL